jgi:hypothetical protein|tara:strand:+ start:569 stop:859 length:291 start_codon:yes stop_codon:yes gene_type:complete
MGSLKQYSNSYGNFSVTRIVTEYTEWDTKKQEHIKLPKQRVTKKVVFTSRDLYQLVDFVRACDIVSDSEGGWYHGNEDDPSERVLRVEFDLDIEPF